MAVDTGTIATALGRDATSTTEELQWDMWISDARMLIAARLGDLDELDQAVLDYVVREAVVLRVRRPDDATQITVSVNDASTSRTYKAGSGRVVILDEWWDLLAPTSSTGKAFEVDTIPEDAGVGGWGVNYVWVTTTDTEPWP